MKNLTRIGEHVSRYGLVFILLSFGLVKFTTTEANDIKPYIDHSPIFSWMYHFFNIQAISNIIGIIEIAAGMMIAARWASTKVAFYGSLLGSAIFFITLSFLFTTPGQFTKTEWIWLPDGFILKDLLLFGFCLWSAGEAYSKISSTNIIKSQK